jgi:hypothetical protein
MFRSSIGLHTNGDMETVLYRSGGWVSTFGFLFAEYFLGGWGSTGAPRRRLAKSVLHAQKKISGGQTD